ncbi:beta-lactamase [Coniosporium apollinis CBS 100218]|uniref:Beta-lactamase n=1 Tax=Coniosporium apollinis (strain CBS 100218) TaxID=1168221 RepID=R7YKX7_CONA1|nr:beta-lactamase [Coniosporium apollinis CBS 100218]EON62562.1 beta-lactamase [Coniosporium apollinis CBS 100218]
MASSQATQAVQSSLDSVTGNPETGIAGLVFVSVDKNGDTLAAAASGNRGLNSKEPMTLDTVFWIASCTKMITGIACMQLVEQGKLSLDDPSAVYKLAPELEKVQCLDEQGKLVDRKGDITLRMLLSHTAGFGYTFFNERLRDFGRPIGLEEFTGDAKDLLKMPLVNQPGDRWEYGINIDWAGILVERASGMKLNAYFLKNIFEPLGLKNITMFPNEEMKSQLASMHQRWGSGKLEERDHLYRRPLMAETEEEQDRIFNSGGAGCFAKPAEYCQILATLLNNGTHPKSGAQILKKETVDTMFENQIPQFPDFARQGIPAAKPDQTNPAPELLPQEGNPPQGWGLTFFLTSTELGMTGRAPNSAWWAGLANLFWWADREKGVAGMIASQVLPFGELQVMGQWFACEKAVYDSLKS